MHSAFKSFGDPIVWNFLVQFFLLALALLLGNTIRRKIPVIRKSLIPTALIGGVCLLLIKLIPGVKGLINADSMEVIAYHCLPLGVIAMSLKRGKGKQGGYFKSVVETGVLTGAIYVLQAVTGLTVTILLTLLLADGFFPGGGILLALGFGQGTGQALNYGKMYEGEFGFVGGTTFGLSIATVGFFVASVVGVAYINILRKKGKLNIKYITDGVPEKLEDYVSDNEIPNTESVDKLTINISLILLCYGIVFVIMRLANLELLWGFNFLLGTVVAIGVKALLNFFQKKKLSHRNLTNDYILDRLSGFLFDLMIIAGVAAIDLGELTSMWWQLTIICTLGTIVTFIYVRIATNHLYKGYEQEAFFSLFGMYTGTASNGMILLREIDPEYKTPASTNLVMSSLPAIIFGGALLLVLGYCPKGIKEASITLGVLIIVLVIYTLVIFRKKIFCKKK